jgi:RNA polymerase-binding transcription factor DksA
MATKKTQSARTSPARSSVRVSAAPLAGTRITARDLQGFRARLEEELHMLCGRRDGLEAASASSMEAAGGLGFADQHSDAGTLTFDRERDQSLVDNLRDLIGKIQAALARMDDGSFGRCETCGQPIEAERLDALPYTTLCLVDARRRARVR